MEETYNEQTKTGGAAIYELATELEKRDKANKGSIQSGTLAGAGAGDPRGYSVVTAAGESVGKVEDLYLDPHTRKPHFALLSLGGHTLGIGNRHVLVAFDDLTITGGKQVQISRAIG